VVKAIRDHYIANYTTQYHRAGDGKKWQTTTSSDFHYKEGTLQMAQILKFAYEFTPPQIHTLPEPDALEEEIIPVCQPTEEGDPASVPEPPASLDLE